ncbi:flavoprotein [Corynebacterium timonense]|uniref:Flavoprotein n=1 Tax=Corynebacterium timonense TaxID=441500 RepID=A0A1H1S2V4_9CORY|nr:Flavoprotein [Corynebacterium timonense]
MTTNASHNSVLPGDVSFDIDSLDGRNLLWVLTGSISAASSPFWVNWVRQLDVRISLRMIITRTAQRFVSDEALTALLGNRVDIDTWEEPNVGALHVDLAQWADGIIVHPCTLDYLSRIALGRGDSPSVLAVQSTDRPIVVCPAVPPGATSQPAYRSHTAALVERPNIYLLDPVSAFSVHTHSYNGTAPAPFPNALSVLADALHGS